MQISFIFPWRCVPDEVDFFFRAYLYTRVYYIRKHTAETKYYLNIILIAYFLKCFTIGFMSGQRLKRRRTPSIIIYTPLAVKCKVPILNGF